MVNAGDKEFLKDKKIKFLVEVEKSAENLGFSVPRVKFWKDRDNNHFCEGERAHIHLESNTICILETELSIMDYDDIKETASHEVSHLKHSDHGTEFHATQSDTKISLWRPPPGTIGVGRKDVKDENKDQRKERIVKYRCNYHICNKKRKTLKCKYCEGYFCEEHINPGMPKIGLSEINNENTHPCFAYINYLDKKKKKDNNEYKKTLKKICKPKSSQKNNDAIKITHKHNKKIPHLHKRIRWSGDIHKLSLKRFKENQKQEKLQKKSIWKKIINFLFVNN